MYCNYSVARENKVVVDLCFAFKSLCINLSGAPNLESQDTISIV